MHTNVGNTINKL